MKLEAVASLGIRLSQLSDRTEAGRTAVQGLLSAFEADVAFIWLPPEPGPCRPEDLFVAGDVLAAVPGEEIATVIRAGAIERWLAARGAAVATTQPIGAAGTAFGLLAAGWRSSPMMGARIDAFLALVAEQLRALLARQRAARRYGSPDLPDVERHPLVLELTRELAQAREELNRRHQMAVTESGLPDDRYRTIFQSTSDYVFVKDIWGRYVDANGAYLSALGRSAEDVLGKRDTDLFPSEFALENTARDHITQISGQTLEDEATWVFGGRGRHLLVRRSPWRDSGGQTIGVVSVASDITERKQADVRRDQALAEVRATNLRIQRLLEEQMRLSQRGSGLLELARRLTVEIDADAIYQLALETAERQLDGAVAAVCNCDPASGAFSIRTRGARGAETLRAGGGEQLSASFGSEVMAGPGAVSVLLDSRFAFDARLLTAGLQATTAIQVPVEGSPVPVVVVAWDKARTPAREDLWFLENLVVQLGLALRNARLYGDLRQSLLAVRAAEQQVRRTERLKGFGELAARIAHDFNNSLTSILGLADWLLYTLPPRAKGREEIEAIRAAAADTANLVGRLRELGRLSPASEARELIDPLEIVRSLPGLLRARLDEERRAGRFFDLVLELGPVPRIRIVPSEFREVLLEFVGNAIEAMPEGGRVTVRSSEVDGRARFAVADEGAGIAEDVRGRLFEPFLTVKRGEHVGLGLSVCRNVAERHGASIEVDSEPGRGSCFTLVVPSGEGEAKGEPTLEATGRPVAEQPSGPEAAPGLLSVLVVDDQPEVLDTVAEMVSALGHRVETASGGDEALTLLARQPVDLILTDLGMPGMSGRELAHRALQACPGLRVVLMTGWMSELGEPLPPGVETVLSKPLTMSMIRSVLDTPADQTA